MIPGTAVDAVVSRCWARWMDYLATGCECPLSKGSAGIVMVVLMIATKLFEACNRVCTNGATHEVNRLCVTCREDGSSPWLSLHHRQGSFFVAAIRIYAHRLIFSIERPKRTRAVHANMGVAQLIAMEGRARDVNSNVVISVKVWYAGWERSCSAHELIFPQAGVCMERQDAVFAPLLTTQLTRASLMHPASIRYPLAFWKPDFYQLPG